MGATLCGNCSTLEAADYPVPTRYLRDATCVEIDEKGNTMRSSRANKLIHVMSYNVLADNLAKPEWFGCSPQILDFEFRGPRVIDEIASSEASILCLQEVDRIDDFYH